MSSTNEFKSGLRCVLIGEMLATDSDTFYDDGMYETSPADIICITVVSYKRMFCVYHVDSPS